MPGRGRRSRLNRCPNLLRHLVAQPRLIRQENGISAEHETYLARERILQQIKQRLGAIALPPQDICHKIHREIDVIPRSQIREPGKRAFLLKPPIPVNERWGSMDNSPFYRRGYKGLENDMCLECR